MLIQFGLTGLSWLGANACLGIPSNHASVLMWVNTQTHQWYWWIYKSLIPFKVSPLHWSHGSSWFARSLQIPWIWFLVYSGSYSRIKEKPCNSMNSEVNGAAFSGSDIPIPSDSARLMLLSRYRELKDTKKCGVTFSTRATHQPHPNFSISTTSAYYVDRQSHDNRWRTFQPWTFRFLEMIGSSPTRIGEMPRTPFLHVFVREIQRTDAWVERHVPPLDYIVSKTIKC